MNQLDIHVEVMRAAGLEDGAILRLAGLKGRLARGECDDLTMEYKRAMFLKHLYAGGRLREWAVSSRQADAAGRGVTVALPGSP